MRKVYRLAMMVGVGIAKAGGGADVEYVRFAADGVGYLIHGMGCVPFIDAMTVVADEK